MQNLLFILFLLITTPVFAGYKVTGNLEVTGNTGIGSSAPTQKLEVIGTAKATRFVGDGSGLTGISAMVYPDAGVPQSTGSAWGTSLSTDGSGDCGSGAVCLGDHTHSSYLTAVASDSDWTVHGSYPTGCTAGEFVSAIGDTLTCGAPAGSGDVTGVGDCASGACFDGTSDGGTYIDLYDAQGAGRLITGDITQARTWTFPDATGTVALTSSNVATATALASDPADCSANQFASSINASGTLGCAALTDADVPNDLTISTSKAVTIGTTTAGTINKVTITAPASGSTLTIADGKTLTVTNTVNLNTMTDGKWCKYTASGTVLNCDQNEPSGSNYWLLGAAGIGTTGAVGVGSSSPQYKLEVQGNVGIGTGTFNAANYLSVNGNVGIGTTNRSAYLSVGGTGMFTGSGNVGIGTTVPGAKLDVVGDIKATGTGVTYFASNVGIGTSAAAKELEVIGNVGIGTTTWAAGKTVYVNYNVGIGSTVPGQTLTVNGNASIGVGTTGAGYVLCVKSAVGTNAVIGYCTSTYSGGVCTCN